MYGSETKYLILNGGLKGNIKGGIYENVIADFEFGSSKLISWEDMVEMEKNLHNMEEITMFLEDKYDKESTIFLPYEVLELAKFLYFKFIFFPHSHFSIFNVKYTADPLLYTVE